MKEAYRVVGCNGKRDGGNVRFTVDMDITVGMVATDFEVIKNERGIRIRLIFNTSMYKNSWYYREEWVEKGFIKDGEFYKENEMQDQDQEAYKVIGKSTVKIDMVHWPSSMDRTVGMISTDFEDQEDGTFKLKFNTPAYKDWWYYHDSWIEKGTIKDGEFVSSKSTPPTKQYALITGDTNYHTFNSKTLYEVVDFQDDSVVLKHQDGMTQRLYIKDITLYDEKDVYLNKEVISPPSKLIKILEDSGYTFDGTEWEKDGKKRFLPEMLQFCGQEPDDSYRWDESWITKTPTVIQKNYNQMINDYMEFKKSLTSDAYYIAKDKQDVLSWSSEDAQMIVEYIRKRADEDDMFLSMVCPFCIKYDLCKICPYGERHMICGNDDSDFNLMKNNIKDQRIEISLKIYDWVIKNF